MVSCLNIQAAAAECSQVFYRCLLHHRRWEQWQLFIGLDLPLWVILYKGSNIAVMWLKTKLQIVSCRHFHSVHLQEIASIDVVEDRSPGAVMSTLAGLCKSACLSGDRSRPWIPPVLDGVTKLNRRITERKAVFENWCDLRKGIWSRGVGSATCPPSTNDPHRIAARLLS